MDAKARIGVALVAASSLVMAVASSAQAQFTTQHTAGASWAGTDLVGQSFTPSADPTPDPGSPTTVDLFKFEFEKSGNTTPPGKTVRLAILDMIGEANLSLPSGLPPLQIIGPAVTVLGMSTNTVSVPAAAADSYSLVFDFDNLTLDYNTQYYAVFVTSEVAGLAVSAFPAVQTTFLEDLPDNPGVFLPQSSYSGGGAIFAGSFLDDFTDPMNPVVRSYFTAAGDTNTNFVAHFTPEPGSAMLLMAAGLTALMRSRRRH